MRKRASGEGATPNSHPSSKLRSESTHLLNGNQAAIRHFSKQLGVELKVTSVQTWKTKYLAELNRKRKAGEKDDLTVKVLPVKELGRDQRTHVCCMRMRAYKRAHAYEIKNTKIYSKAYISGHLYENLHQRKFPAIRYVLIIEY